MNVISKFPINNGDFMKLQNTNHTPKKLKNKKKHYRASKTFQNSSEDVCAICLNDINNSKIIRKLTNCNHYFCNKCIVCWCSFKKNCPLCKCEMTKKEMRWPSDSFLKNTSLNIIIEHNVE